MASPRLPTGPRERISETRRRSELHRSASAAWQEMTYGHAEHVGRAIGRGADIVHKMGQPQSAERPYNETLLLAMEAALDLGHAEDLALSPLRWLNRELGQIVYSRPELVPGHVACLHQQLAHTIKELAEYTHLAATLVAEGKLEEWYLPQLEREAEEGIRAALELLQALQQEMRAGRRRNGTVAAAKPNGDAAGAAGEGTS